MKPSLHRIATRFLASETDDWLHRAQGDEDDEGESIPTDTSGHPYPAGGQRESALSKRLAAKFLLAASVRRVLARSMPKRTVGPYTLVTRGIPAYIKQQGMNDPDYKRGRARILAIWEREDDSWFGPEYVVLSQQRSTRYTEPMVPWTFDQGASIGARPFGVSTYNSDRSYRPPLPGRGISGGDYARVLARAQVAMKAVEQRPDASWYVAEVEAEEVDDGFEEFDEWGDRNYRDEDEEGGETSTITITLANADGEKKIHKLDSEKDCDIAAGASIGVDASSSYGSSHGAGKPDVDQVSVEGRISGSGAYWRDGHKPGRVYYCYITIDQATGEIKGNRTEDYED